MAQVGVVADAVHTGACRKGWVHQHDRGAERRQIVGDGFGVVARDGRAREQPGQKPGACGGELVKMKRPVGLLAERTRSHHSEHAGAGGRFEDDIAWADGGGLERGIGERQRRGELLQPELLLGALCVRRLQCRDGDQHRQHPAGAVRSGACGPAHGAAVALEEQHGGGFGGLVGVLPDPGARSIGRTEGLRHGIPEGRGIERQAGLQHRQQSPRCREQGVGPGRMGRRLFGMWVGDDGGKGRARESVRRRMGIEHGDLRAGRA